MTKHSRRSPIVPNVNRLRNAPNGVGVNKYVRMATGAKRYTPVVRGKELRLSWTTKTRAEVYGAMILNRYVAKLAVAAKNKKAKENTDV